MSKVITVQDGNIEFNVAFSDGDFDANVIDGNINIGANATFAGSLNLGTSGSMTDATIGSTAVSAILVSDAAHDGIGFYSDGSSPLIVSSNFTGYVAVAGVGGSLNPNTGDTSQDAGLTFTRDNTNFQDVSFVGYAGTKDFDIHCFNYGAHIDIQSTTTAGTQRVLIHADPDDAVTLYNAGNAVAETAATGSGGFLVDKGSGLEEIAVLSEITGGIPTPLIVQGSILTATPPTNEAITSLLRFDDSDSTDTVGFVGFIATDAGVMTIANSMHGSNMKLIVENAAGAAQTLVTLDPDAESVILPQTDDAVTPTLAFGDGNTGLYESADNILRVAINGSAAWRFTSTQLGSTNSGRCQLQQATPSATVPNILPDGGDTDTGIGKNADDQLSLVSGGVEMLRLVETGTATTDQIIIAPAGIIGAEATPALAFGDGDTGFFESVDDTLNVSILGSARHQFNGNFIRSNNATGYGVLNEASSATNPTVLPNHADANTGIGQSAVDQLSLIAGSVEMLRLVETGTATTDQIIIGPAGVIGAVATPSLAFGDGDTGFYENADDSLYTAIAGVAEWFIDNGQAGSTISTGPRFRLEGATATNPTVIPSGGDGNTGLGQNAADEVSVITGAVEATRFIARTVQTTTAAVTEIVSLAVASGESFGFEVHVMGTEDATGDTVFERVFGAIRNQGGTTALVGSTITDRTDDAGATTWVISVEADDTGDALTVDVTGEGSHTIDWKVRVELLNV
jgi:hypothetical protein